MHLPALVAQDRAREETTTVRIFQHDNLYGRWKAHLSLMFSPAKTAVAVFFPNTWPASIDGV